MKKVHLFVIAITIAHLCLFISFIYQPISFWASFTISFSILIIYAICFGRIPITSLKAKHFLISLLSGFGLYVLCLIGNELMKWIFPHFINQLAAFYEMVEPISWWHFLALFLIVIPGEELFWRGFVLEKLVIINPSPKKAIFWATMLYASVNLYSGSILLIIATIIAGIIWSWLYLYTKNIISVIISHVVFDLFLLIVFPLL